MPSSTLYLPFKVPVRYDLVQPLANWLDNDDSHVAFHKENIGNSCAGVDAAPAMIVPKPAYNSVQCRSELLRIAALRNCMSEALQDSHRTALEEHEMLRDCQDYHATLLEFEKRGFPTGGGGDADEENGIDLTWRGAFSDDDDHGAQKAGCGGNGVPETHHTLLWDRACTLWNIAALRSASAALETDDKTKEGLKSAISSLQQAASHLSLCRQILDHSRENEYISTVDLSKAMLQFWEKLLLAQAQTCIYKLANLGGSSVRNHTTLAYLIQGAAPLYNEALILAQDPRLQSELPTRCREWAAHCKARSLVCQARAYFHMSIEGRLTKAHGLEIGRLNQTISALDSVLDFCRSTQVLKEAITLAGGGKSGKGSAAISPIAEAAATIQPEAEGLLRLASDRRKAAEEDNRTVYMEHIPKPRDLQEIRAQTMVKTDLPLPETMVKPRTNLFGWE